MKNILLLTCIILYLAPAAHTQDPIDILKQAYLACQSVENGYYEMTSRMKYMSGKDTTTSSYSCHFRKLKEDTLFSTAFHHQSYWKDTFVGHVLYTGNELVTTYERDSSARIMSKEQWAEEIDAIKHNYNFYSPLTEEDSSPLPKESAFTDDRYTFIYLGDVALHHGTCYHLRMHKAPKNEPDDFMQVIKQEYDFWISKDDHIPVQYSSAVDLVMNNDTMYQYEIITLNTYSINSLTDEHILTLDALPDYYTLKEYVPYTRPELLPNDTIAPAWTLPSLTGDTVRLSDLLGNLVIVDFFYKSCYPCMLALPGLQELHEKYYDRGLRVIGVNPYDKKEDDLAAFLYKRGVTYPILLEAKEAANQYRVSGYPTLYVVDRNGNIVYSQVGYGKEAEEKLEEFIVSNL
jgi:peroxiredoxin